MILQLLIPIRPIHMGNTMRQLQQHVKAVYALTIRDLMARFGRDHLGFVWTILEPMILCTGVLIIWSYIHEPVLHGIPIIELAFTGYMPLTLWRHLTAPLALILRRNVSLLYHFRIAPIDVILARSTLEFISTSAGAGIIYFVLHGFGMIEPVEHLDLVLIGWAYTGWYYGAMGVFIAAMTETWEIAEKFVQPINYLMLPISGTFFLVDWMPHWAQKLLLFNPSVNCFEMIRAGAVGEAITSYYSIPYITAACIGATLMAIWSVRGVRDRIEIG